MTNRTISVGRSPRIVLELVGGDLGVVGWEGEDLLIKADEDDLRIDQQGELVTISTGDDLVLRVPRDASLSIQSVGGDMTVRGVNGDLSVNEVRGDASVRDVNNIAIVSIRSDFSLRNARGNLSVKSISGDASVREVQGSVSLDSVSDDLLLREVRGDLKAIVGEDVVLYLEPQPGRNYSVNAGEDILLILAPDANANLALSGDEIHVSWPGIPFEEDATSRTVTLGSGAANVSLNAGGDLRVSSQDRAQQSPDEFGNFAAMMFDWSDFGTQLGERISRRVEEATHRAARQAERAARRAEAKLRGPRGRGKLNMGAWNWNIDSSTITPPAPREPVSEQERMAILKMLAEKKISTDEADTLLAALDGGGQ